MARKNRTPEENERRAKIRELLQASNINSIHSRWFLIVTPSAYYAFDILSTRVVLSGFAKKYRLPSAQRKLR